MMKLADMLGLGSSEETLEGSSPSIRNMLYAFVKTTFLLLTLILEILNSIEEFIKVSDNFLFGVFINSFAGKNAT